MRMRMRCLSRAINWCCALFWIALQIQCPSARWPPRPQILAAANAAHFSLPESDAVPQERVLQPQPIRLCALQWGRRRRWGSRKTATRQWVVVLIKQNQKGCHVKGQGPACYSRESIHFQLQKSCNIVYTNIIFGYLNILVLSLKATRPFAINIFFIGHWHRILKIYSHQYLSLSTICKLHTNFILTISKRKYYNQTIFNINILIYFWYFELI